MNNNNQEVKNAVTEDMETCLENTKEEKKGADYISLMEELHPVGNSDIMKNTAGIGEWKLVNGCDMSREIIMYCIVSDSGVKRFMEETDEIVYYNEELDLYVWGVTQTGMLWDMSLNKGKGSLHTDSEEKRYFNGYKITEYGIKHGFKDIEKLIDELGIVEKDRDFIRNIGRIGTWKRVNGDYFYYFDLHGYLYDSASAYKRIKELRKTKRVVAEKYAAFMERDIIALQQGEERPIFNYLIISEAGAKLLMNETNEIVFYNSELDMYIWGMSQFGIHVCDFPFIEKSGAAL